MLVLNIRDSASARCSCGSWLNHWAKFGGQTTLAVCSAVDCYQVATVGAYVTVNGKTVIVPMCDHHHQQEQPVDVFDYTFAVSAEVARTCGKLSFAELGLGALAGLPPHRFQVPVKVAGFLAGLINPPEPARTAAEDEDEVLPSWSRGGKRNGAW